MQSSTPLAHATLSQTLRFGKWLEQGVTPEVMKRHAAETTSQKTDEVMRKLQDYLEGIEDQISSLIRDLEQHPSFKEPEKKVDILSKGKEVLTDRRMTLAQELDEKTAALEKQKKRALEYRQSLKLLQRELRNFPPSLLEKIAISITGKAVEKIGHCSYSFSP